MSSQAELTLNKVLSRSIYELNPLSPNVAYQRETFSFMMSHPAMSLLGDRFCDSRKGGTGGGGRVHPERANSMAVSGLHGRKVLVGTGKAISAVISINGLRK